MTSAQRTNARYNKIYKEAEELQRKSLKTMKECPICHKKFKDEFDKIGHAMFGCRK